VRWRFWLTFCNVTISHGRSKYIGCLPVVHIWSDIITVPPWYEKLSIINYSQHYGLYEYAQIWATKRFEFANIYSANYMNRFLLHSERMAGRLIEYYHIPYELKKICFLRINLRVARDECGFPGVRSVEESSSDLWWKEILRLLPHDYYQVPWGWGYGNPNGSRENR